MSLTRKQQAFITEYLVDFNATQAAVRAGYSERSANNIGPGNLLKPIIKAEIERQIAEKAMGKDEVLLSLGKFGRGEIEEQDTKDRLKALELLGKHYKMFTDKTEIVEIDLSALSDEQLKRLADGEDILNVLGRDG